jgi:hypothetical protein
VTTFWRPIPTADAPFYQPTWVAGPKVYALWGRCDRCKWSASFDQFILLEKCQAYITVCGECDRDNTFRRGLTKEGWELR